MTRRIAMASDQGMLIEYSLFCYYFIKVPGYPLWSIHLHLLSFSMPSTSPQALWSDHGYWPPYFTCSWYFFNWVSCLKHSDHLDDWTASTVSRVIKEYPIEASSSFELPDKMTKPTFVNYYQMLGITEEDDRITARSKLRAALVFNHPDRNPAGLKNEYTEKSAILSADFEIFSDEKSFKTWKREYDDEIWKWFKKLASKRDKPMNGYVPVVYLKWLDDGATWYELKHISSWRRVERVETAKLAEETEEETHKQNSKKGRPKNKNSKPQERSGAKKEKPIPRTPPKRQPAKPKTKKKTSECTNQKAQNKQSSKHTSETEADSGYKVPREADYIVIDDDDEEEADRPSARTRSKTSKAQTGMGSHGIGLGAQCSNTPDYGSPVNKLKRKRNATGFDDDFAASLLTERVRTPYWIIRTPGCDFYNLKLPYSEMKDISLRVAGWDFRVRSRLGGIQAPVIHVSSGRYLAEWLWIFWYFISPKRKSWYCIISLQAY